MIFVAAADDGGGVGTDDEGSINKGFGDWRCLGDDVEEVVSAMAFVDVSFWGARILLIHGGIQNFLFNY